MNLIIVIVVAVVLFGLAFLSKRRFGMHGLALVAGATLAALWGETFAVLVASAGVLPYGIPAEPLVMIVLTVAPGLMLLLRGKKYKNIGGRTFGAIMFTALALALIVTPLSILLPLDAASSVAYATILQYKSLIIGGGIVVAVLDILFAKTAKPVPEEKHRH